MPREGCLPGWMSLRSQSVAAAPVNKFKLALEPNATAWHPIKRRLQNSRTPQNTRCRTLPRTRIVPRFSLSTGWNCESRICHTACI